jgi:hypothetical protein
MNEVKKTSMSEFHIIEVAILEKNNGLTIYLSIITPPYNCPSIG